MNLNAQELLKEAIDDLEKVSRDISQEDIQELLQYETKVCFITCNSYEKEKYFLGAAPVNDAVTVANYHRRLGFKCVHLHNPSAKLFLSTFDKLLQMPFTHLTIFFGGHGGTVSGESTIVFDNGYIRSSVLNSHTKQLARPDTCKLIVSDCCNSGSVWCEGDLPQNTISLCSSPGITPSKQAVVCGKAQGLFSFFFWRNATKLHSLPLSAIIRSTNKYLSRFDQEIKCECNPKNAKNEVLFADLTRRNNSNTNNREY